ncbi:MAG TPA: M48 family metallopeptidase [Firmicutes bacterium]|nr:M48 family metallopeptidase [Bacillota bacterium]HOQ23487.1 M48 family metallopeptidase [Bacillota bacterium]HPT67982.1 M48 family metallopeptidase [Bacillota bacterium]
MAFWKIGPRGEVEFLGLQIVAGYGTARSGKAEVVAGTLRLTIPRGLNGRLRRELVEALVWRALARCYRGRFQERMEVLNCELMQVSTPRLDIRRQYRRWGSYSSRGYIHLSHRLLLAPQDLVDYVILHELAHVKEMNHSARFWRLVAKACPDYKERRQKLARFSLELPGRGRVPAEVQRGIEEQLRRWL